MTATDAERRQHSRRHRAGRSRGRSHTRRTSAACARSTAPCVCATPAPPQGPQSCLQVSAHRTRPAAARLTGDLRTGGRTSSSPVHGCLPPPLQGGQSGSGAGAYSAPAHHLAPGTSNCEPSVPLTVQHLHLRLLVLNTFTLRRSEGAKYSTPPAKDEDAGP